MGSHKYKKNFELYDSLRELPIHNWNEFNLYQDEKWLIKTENRKLNNRGELIKSKILELTDEFAKLVNNDIFESHFEANRLMDILSKVLLIEKYYKNSEKFDYLLGLYSTDSRNYLRRIDTLKNQLTALKPILMQTEKNYSANYLSTVISVLAMDNIQVNQFTCPVTVFYSILNDYNKKCEMQKKQMRK